MPGKRSYRRSEALEMDGNANRDLARHQIIDDFEDYSRVANNPPNSPGRLQESTFPENGWLPKPRRS